MASPDDNDRPPSAVILLSGGLDSATTLAIARDQGFSLRALTFRYGQRHEIEVEAAKRVARQFAVAQPTVVDIDLRQFGGSALTDSWSIPKGDSVDSIGDQIPITYVPARNTIFLSFALAYAEVNSASDIFLGVNALDYSGYPDCRPEYIRAFEQMANLATKVAIEGRPFTIHTPLIAWTKAEIIQRGLQLGVDYSLTISCYDPTVDGVSCGRCDACLLRRQGFAENGMTDPIRYANQHTEG